MANNWEFNGQVLIRVRKKSKFKNKKKMFLEVNKKKSRKKSYVLERKKWMKSSIFLSNKLILFSIKKWENNLKKLVKKKNSKKNWNFWRKPYQLTQSHNLTCLLTKWPIHANTSVKNKNMLFCKKNLERSNKQKSKNKEQWRKIKGETLKKRRCKKLNQQSSKKCKK